MTVKDIDIDVYDDVCEDLAIAFIGPVKLTPEGEKRFKEVLGYQVELGDRTVIVKCDGENWKKKLHNAKELFHSAAGYCPESEYRMYFEEA